MSSELIEAAIRNGHTIAAKIKNAATAEEVTKLNDEIEVYTDFIDENFGTPGDLGEEKINDLSTMLYMAAEEKARQLEYYPNQDEIGNKDIIEFEQKLDSKDWIKNSAE